jgi:hypothetical protein
MNALAMKQGAALHISSHAISRYIERVANVSADIAEQALSSPAIRKAVEIGCGSVKLPGGQRVIIVGNVVVTVRPRLRCKRRSHGRRERESE